MNSRVPRFRAFDRVMKTTNEVLEIDFVREKVCVNYSNCFHNWLSFQDVTLLQFTGLSDVTGQAIYEGDIVLDDEANAFLVIFLEDSASFAAQSVDNETVFLPLKKIIESGCLLGQTIETPFHSS